MPVCPICGDENPQLGAMCPKDGGYFIHDDAIEHAKNDPMIGHLAAEKYVIVGRISKGGMGAVYRALQLPVEREVAFKVLRTEIEDSSQSRDRFIREARAVSRLSHANIITLYDFGFEPNGQPYMVMEYAPGASLADWLMRPDLTFERIISVCRQLLSALAEAHERGIVHRDLKPENMIITQKSSGSEELKLLDFGIARMINERSTKGLTREGEVFGTPHYMAPEQAQGAKEVGPPADVYAVGIMMYELLTSQAPYDAPTPLAVLLMHINEPLPPLIPRSGVLVPKEFMAVLHKAVEKEPGDRFANASEMLQAINAWYNPSVEVQYSRSATQSNPGINAHDTVKTPFLPQTPTPSVEQLYDPSASQSYPSYADSVPGAMGLDTLDTWEDEPAPKKSKLALIALLLVVLIGGAAITLGVVMSGENDAVANNTPSTQTEGLGSSTTTAPEDTQVVVKDTQEDPPKELVEPVKEPETPPNMNVEPVKEPEEPPVPQKDPPQEPEVKEPEVKKTPKRVVKKTRPKKPEPEPKVEPEIEPKPKTPTVQKWGADTKKPAVKKWGTTTEPKTPKKPDKW